MDTSRGKYFYLSNNVFGLVLDILNENKQVHARVGVWQKKQEAVVNQLWYFHHYTGTIRSKLNHFCLIVNRDNDIVMSPFDMHNTTRWRLTGNRIHLDGQFDRCIQTIADEPDAGNYIKLGKYSGYDNQHWFVEYIQPAYFYLRSKLNDRVLDVENSSSRPKSRLIMWDRKAGAPNQLWYEDGLGHIHSKLNHFVLDIDEEGENRLVINPKVPESQTQQWVVEGDYLVNHSMAGQVLDIERNDKRNGATLMCYERHGELNQRWELEFYI